MKQIDFVKGFVQSLPDTTEEPHFEKVSFRVKKQIFATYDGEQNKLCVKLSEVDQDVFAMIDKDSIYPVPNKWGKQGWTFVELDILNDDIVEDILTTAYLEIAPKKLANQIRSGNF